MNKKVFCKLLVVNVLCLFLQMISFNVYSQSDGFFNGWEDFENRGSSDPSAPSMPGHGSTDDQNMPLGGGLLILGGLGLGYVAFKKRKSFKKGAMIVLILLSYGVEAQVPKVNNYDTDWNLKKPSENNKIGYVAVKEDGKMKHNAQYEIGVFCGNECRGKAKCNVVGYGYYLASLQIYGSDNDELTFRVYDHNNNGELFSACKNTVIKYKDLADPIFAPPSNPIIADFSTYKYIFCVQNGNTNDVNSYRLMRSDGVGGEWTPEALPLSNCRVVYNADVTYADANAQVKDVIISEGKKMEITAGGGLKVVDSVRNPNGVDGILLKASAPQTAKGGSYEEYFSNVASLVCVEPNIEGTMETYFDNSSALSEAPDWHFISSPVASQVIYENGSLADQPFKPGKSDDFYLWDETTCTWCNIKSNDFSTTNAFYTVNDGFNFVPGRGYLASYKTAGVKSYQGTFNNGDVTVAMTYTDEIDDKENIYAGFNLVGNPYPSFLDWEDTTGWNRSKIYGYGTKESNSNCVIWIYNEDAGNYATYVQGTKVSTNGGTRYIAPGQGFFVKATSAGNLVMKDGARTNEHTESGFMKRQDGINRQDLHDEHDVLKIRVENSNFGADEVALAVSENAMNVDKLFSLSETAPALYFNDGNDDYSIMINNEFDNSISLNFKAKQMGKYTIKLNPESVGFDYVELEDSFTGEKTNLLVDEYSFAATTDDNENRFRLNLNYGIGNGDSENEDFAYINGNELIVKGKGTLCIVDVLGRTIYEKELTSEENSISIDYINKGVNIVKLGNKTQKIIIR